MEKIFIASVALYALFVGLYLLYLNAGKRRKKDIVGKGASIHETGQVKTDIVGKSQFDLTASKPLSSKQEPLTASPPESENRQENPDTFVPTDEEKSSAEVPPEELDEAFSDTSPEDNEPMDIHYPLDYQSRESDNEEPEDGGEDEEEEVAGTAQAALASGVPFEDLGNAVRTVNKADEATAEQKQRAGNTLLEIRQTDMFEQVVSGKPDAKRIVTSLMAESLADFHRRKDTETGAGGDSRKAPDHFNVRDFA